ncbi:adenylate/guanylate cyclase domain-containing protein [Adhaeretor mobilis]|uniref:Adenylate and Guanylate cyclase catalytic domain protein n=1 Tax=Adhaeretor mobilis TaxID=1930276 RepID=A0A517MUB1_9BACT|nr:adenylate/guanylate cyclase domain-containing protein [Adhaeretor mobilis]QDS98469.1 Adenylate and Guanylate cyclase catalytic domain protein [Adhaeretor mobilis]
MIASLDEVFDFAKEQYKQAKEGADKIVFPVEKYSREFSMSEGKERGGVTINASGHSITDLPQYDILKNATGLSAWAAILNVDLRYSSQIAMEYGAEKTFLLMHTYLPTMAFLVEKGGGNTVGLRGDGLFAAYGVTELDGEKEVVDGQAAAKAVQEATDSGKAMIEAVEDVLSAVLKDERLGDLKIGVGVDVGSVVITRIGLKSASEVTAYGPTVNRACKKLAAKAVNKIHVSQAAERMFPQSKGGKVKFTKFDGYFEMHYPSDVRMLDGESDRRSGSRR